ncbi:MAG TPA: isoprenylcysteine carboxylmethyltransferase family protein [Terracidiphilus sp.]|nr:isoprenylcysteine carboxylmethyltransferase family protein [Terracidiphilus sp.]
MLEYIALGEMLVCWIVWCLAFVKPRREAAGQKKAERAPASRWGIACVFIAFFLVWVGIRPAGYHQPAAESIASMILGPLSVVLVWASAHRLGKQWRFEAAVSEDHELIQTGAYRWLRHPIYASMLGMFLTTGLAWSWWPMAVIGVAFFIAGTEIRIAAEERLLTKHFPSYAEYRERAWAYIPFIR